MESVRGEVGSKGLLCWRLLPHAVAAMLTEQSKREGEPVDAPGADCRARARVQGSVPTAWR